MAAYKLKSLGGGQCARECRLSARLMRTAASLANALFPYVFQVMREVCVNGSVDLDGAGSGSPVHKPELEKVTHSYTDRCCNFCTWVWFL